MKLEAQNMRERGFIAQKMSVKSLSAGAYWESWASNIGLIPCGVMNRELTQHRYKYTIFIEVRKRTTFY